mmetsp:Transcript_23234/g.43982  ORF Transcript_23234/g.43982 Transcript_23234/m.43982 type:complete len:432 (+) Transcript_23234:1472-2767(+)
MQIGANTQNHPSSSRIDGILREINTVELTRHVGQPNGRVERPRRRQGQRRRPQVHARRQPLRRIIGFASNSIAVVPHDGGAVAHEQQHVRRRTVRIIAVGSVHRWTLGRAVVIPREGNRDIVEFVRTVRPNRLGPTANVPLGGGRLLESSEVNAFSLRGRVVQRSMVHALRRLGQRDRLDDGTHGRLFPQTTTRFLLRELGEVAALTLLPFELSLIVLVFFFCGLFGVFISAAIVSAFVVTALTRIGSNLSGIVRRGNFIHIFLGISNREVIAVVIIVVLPFFHLFTLFCIDALFIVMFLLLPSTLLVVGIILLVLLHFFLLLPSTLLVVGSILLFRTLALDMNTTILRLLITNTVHIHNIIIAMGNPQSKQPRIRQSHNILPRTRVQDGRSVFVPSNHAPYSSRRVCQPQCWTAGCAWRSHGNNISNGIG